MPKAETTAAEAIEGTNVIKAPDQHPEGEGTTPAPEQVSIMLEIPLVNNGDKLVVYGPGKVTVDEATAEDLLRRQSEYFKSERDRLEGTDRSNNNLGTIG